MSRSHILNDRLHLWSLAWPPCRLYWWHGSTPRRNTWWSLSIVRPAKYDKCCIFSYLAHWLIWVRGKFYKYETSMDQKFIMERLITDPACSSGCAFWAEGEFLSAMPQVATGRNGKQSWAAPPYPGLNGRFIEWTCGMGTEQDVSLLSWRLLIKHMSVKTQQCLCRCVRLDQDSHGRISFPTSSPHFTSSSAGPPPLYVSARLRKKGLYVFREGTNRSHY